MKAKKFFYSNGFHFTDAIKKNIDPLIGRIFIEKTASCVVCDGQQGSGKTTLACQTAKYVTEVRGKTFDINTQYALGGEEFMEKLAECYLKKLPALVYDEASDFDSRGANSAFNKNLNSIFEIFRKFQVLVIIVRPHFRKLDGGIFQNGIPRVLFHCYGKKANRYSNVKIYSLVRMRKMREMIERRKSSAENVYGRVYPNGFGHFKDFEPKFSSMLDNLTGRQKFDVLMEKQNKFGQKDMAERLGRSVQWVRGMLKKLKQKEVLVHKNKKFYDEKVYSRLQRAIKEGHTLYN